MFESEDVKKFLIEHPGDAYFNELSEQVKLMIEEDLGHDADVVIGDSNGRLSVLTEAGQVIFTTSIKPTLKSLRLYLSLS